MAYGDTIEGPISQSPNVRRQWVNLVNPNKHAWRRAAEMAADCSRWDVRRVRLGIPFEQGRDDYSYFICDM